MNASTPALAAIEATAVPTLPVETQPISRLAALEQPRDRHRDDAILVGEARPVAGVVLQVQVVQAELGAEPVGADQRCVAGVLSHARLRARVDDREQLLEVPDVLRALGAREVPEVAGRQLVVVDDVQALAAVRAGEHGVGERIVMVAAMADELRRARACPLAGPLLRRCSAGRAHAGTRDDTPGHGVCVSPSLPSAIHSSSAMCGASGAEQLREHAQTPQQRLAIGRAQLVGGARARASRSP